MNWKSCAFTGKFTSVLKHKVDVLHELVGKIAYSFYV